VAAGGHHGGGLRGREPAGRSAAFRRPRGGHRPGGGGARHPGGRGDALLVVHDAGIYAIGHVSRDLLELGAQSEATAISRVTWLIHKIVPDLESFNLTVQAIHQLPIEASQIWLPIGYALCYVVAMLGLASLIFERRDFR
jgi:hypothetical protein